MISIKRTAIKDQFIFVEFYQEDGDETEYYLTFRYVEIGGWRIDKRCAPPGIRQIIRRVVNSNEKKLVAKILYEHNRVQKSTVNYIRNRFTILTNCAPLIGRPDYYEATS